VGSSFTFLGNNVIDKLITLVPLCLLLGVLVFFLTPIIASDIFLESLGNYWSVTAEWWGL